MKMGNISGCSCGLSFQEHRTLEATDLCVCDHAQDNLHVVSLVCNMQLVTFVIAFLGILCKVTFYKRVLFLSKGEMCRNTFLLGVWA